MKALEKLFGIRPRESATAPASEDFAARLDAMNANAAIATTPEQAIAVMRESAGITNDLFKSFNGKPKDEEEGEEEKAPEPEEKPETTEPETPAADEGDEPTSDNPDDADLMADAPASDAPAAAPEAITAASGKEGDATEEKPAADTNAALAKSIPEVLAGIGAGEGEEPLVDASELVTALLKSIGATQEREVTNSASLETIMDYQEQLGAMLTKSMEGQQIIYNRQQEIFDRLGAMEISQTEAQQTNAERMEGLNKSIAGMARAPQGTPSGRAPLASNSVAGLALTDAAPLQTDETYNGWTRTELKKSIEGHIRSDRCTESGITTADFLDIGRIGSIADLDPRIFEVANAERKRGAKN